MIHFPCADGSAPLESAALLFSPPTIIAGKVGEEEFYRWLRVVTRALEQEEARAMNQPTILGVYLEEDMQETAQLVIDRELSELRDTLDTMDEQPPDLGWQCIARPRFCSTQFKGPRVYRDFDEEEDGNKKDEL